MPGARPRFPCLLRRSWRDILLSVLGYDVETARYISLETQATIGMSDVSNCFHRLLVEDALPDYFALDRDFTTSDFGLTGHVHEGREMKSTDSVWVASRSLPMEVLMEPLFCTGNDPSPVDSGPSGVLFPTPHRPTAGSCAADW